MLKNSKKVAVLNLLRQQSAPVSLSTLMQQLGDQYAERSVRRWLTEMINAGLIRKTGQKRSTLYHAIFQSPFSDAGQKIIQQITQPLFTRSPTSYHSAWLDEYHPNKTFYFSKQSFSALHAAGESNKSQQPAGTYAHHIYNRLLIDLSYNSSRLEGNTYSLLETQRLIIEGEKATGKLDGEAIMILNHKEAIRYLVDHAVKKKFHEDTIYTVHFLLSDALIPSQFCGKVRNHGVRISGSTYIPLENPTLLQKQLNLICKKAALIKEPFEASLFLLVHLAYLQAFVDVNKRTSRLSANFPLIKNNLIPLSFNDMSQEDYINAMIAIYELNELQPLIDLYIQSYLRTCEAYNATVSSLGFDEIRVRYRQQRRDIIRHIILNHLHNDAMDRYIQKQSKTVVKKNELASFIEDIYEDIKQINASRLVGMGITQQQLRDWEKCKVD